MTKAIRPLRTWTVRIGGRSLGSYRQSFEQDGIEISSFLTRRELEDVAFEPRHAELDLALIPSSAFGVTEDCDFSVHAQRAKERGYYPAPPESAFALRDEYRDQSDGEWLTMAMHPLGSGGGYDTILRLVNHEGRLRLWWGWMHFSLTGYLAYKPGPSLPRIWQAGELRPL